MKRLIIILALLAALLIAWRSADVCIDDLDHCYPDSPIPAAELHQVYLPIMAR